MTDTDEQRDEKVYLATHKHWAAFFQDNAVVILPCAAGLFALFLYSRFSVAFVSEMTHVALVLLFPFALLLFWILLAGMWTKFHLDTLILTDQRLLYVAQPTFTKRTIAQWNIHDVHSASARMDGFLGSFFGYGTINIRTNTEEAPTQIEGIPEPERICTLILKEDRRMGELAETAQRQQELLHFISHEVKGHLAKSKAAFASIIEGDFGPVPPPLESLAHDAYADAEKGVHTVMSILDTSDLSSGTMRFNMKPFDYAAMVRREADEFAPQIDKKGLMLTVSIEPCNIVGDEGKIERHVVRNLIENALRYTPSGRITVTLERADDTARLSVTDSGVGIAPSDMKKLFTEGGHGEHSREINQDSTGFGLFIAKRVIDAHGGRIWAESSGSHQGSTFIAELPLSRQQ